MLVDRDVEDWLKDKRLSYVPPLSVIRKPLKAAGLSESPDRLKVDGRAAWVFATFPLQKGEGWPSVKPHRVVPEHLFPARI